MLHAAHAYVLKIGEHYLVKLQLVFIRPPGALHSNSALADIRKEQRGPTSLSS